MRMGFLHDRDLNEDTRASGSVATLAAFTKAHDYARNVLKKGKAIILNKVDAPEGADMPLHRYEASSEDGGVSAAFLLNADPSINGAENTLIVDAVIENLEGQGFTRWESNECDVPIVKIYK